MFSLSSRVHIFCTLGIMYGSTVGKKIKFLSFSLFDVVAVRVVVEHTFNKHILHRLTAKTKSHHGRCVICIIFHEIHCM